MGTPNATAFGATRLSSASRVCWTWFCVKREQLGSRSVPTMDRYGNYQAPVPGGAVRRAHETMGAGEDTSGGHLDFEDSVGFFRAAPCATRRIESWRETVSGEPSRP